MTTLFISDLHLDPERPAITALFGRFLDGRSRGADALYILGDLFEAWVGDDDPSDAGAASPTVCARLADAGVPVYFIRGNRDFLLGLATRRAGMRCCRPERGDLYGTPTVLLHGDLLCTDDPAYQQFRAQTRDPRWQAQFLSQPLAGAAGVRRAGARGQQGALRRTGQCRHRRDRRRRGEERPSMRCSPRSGVGRMIHGHTHRPAIHDEGNGTTRIVLGDWYEQGSVLRVDPDGVELASL
jgi:UDP-2,3-diacylglucosamine hydrolase